MRPARGRELQERDELSEKLALSALDGAACELQVPREDLVFVIADPSERDEFIAEHGVTEEQLDAALEAGLVRAVDDAERAGDISSFEATLLREVAARVPAAEAIDVIESATGDDVLGLVDDLIDQVEGGKHRDRPAGSDGGAGNGARPPEARSAASSSSSRNRGWAIAASASPRPWTVLP